MNPVGAAAAVAQTGNAVTGGSETADGAWPWIVSICRMGTHRSRTDISHTLFRPLIVSGWRQSVQNEEKVASFLELQLCGTTDKFQTGSTSEISRRTQD